MPKTYVKRSVIIDSPIEKIFPLVNNFTNWTAWSPWAILEKEAKVNVKKDGKFFEWEGTRIGSGNMTITSEKVNESIHADLTFLKPWKSHAKIVYTFKKINNSTEVSWEMHSSLPFFMFWMKQMMQNMIGMDFDRGLKMLKDLVETGSVKCKLDHDPTAIFKGEDYIGFSTTSSIDKIGVEMSETILKLKSFIKENNINSNGEVVTIYHKWDIKKMMATYTVGVFVESIPSQLPADMKSGSIETTSVNSVRLTGDYEHIGNAWSMQMMMQRNKEFKQNKKMDPFEIYKNSPYNTASEELVTEVMFPTI